MRASKRGFTIIEILISTSILAVVTGSILGAFMVMQRCFYDGIAMAKSQAAARVVIEKMVCPIRHGKSFNISDDGDKLTLTKYDGTEIAFVFGNDKIEESIDDSDPIRVWKNIVKIPNEDVFQELAANERVGINFGVKNEGIVGNFKEVHISTEVKLRN